MKDQPFEGDTFIWPEIQKLIENWDVGVIIETGTEYGATTRKLAESHLPVFTIESDYEKYKSTWRRLAQAGIVPLFGESERLLPPLIEAMETDRQLLFFLDAHNNDGSVIREELKAIRKTQLFPIVIVHDVKVPEKDFGYDIYSDGSELTLDYFKDLLDWPHNCYYNQHADGARRGVLYITPKYPDIACASE